MEVVHEIIELIPDDYKPLQHTKSQMFSDAALLTGKIAGAESVLYDIKMEAATIIRKAAVYDPDGIDGASMFQLYVNGILHFHSNETGLNDYATPTPGWPFQIGGSEWRHAYGVVDNIKIYDYAKTDFSDREIE